MTLPHATPEDVQEQSVPVVDEAVSDEEGLRDDAPEADVAEQRREVVLDEEDAPIG